MARPKKYNADYFSHDTDMRNDLKIKALRSKFGHKGYACWCMILETLGHCDYFEYEWTELNIELLATDLDLSVEELTDFIDYCLKLKLLQIENNYLICDKFTKRLMESLGNKRDDFSMENAKRKNLDKINPTNTEFTERKLSDNTQSKVKQSKVNESKVTNEASASEIAERQKLDEQFEKGWKVYCNINGSIKPRGSKKKAKEYFNKMDATEKRKALNAMKYIAMETEHQYRIHLSRLLAPTEKRYRDYQHLSIDDIQVQRKVNDPHPTDDRLMWSGQEWILKEEEWN